MVRERINLEKLRKLLPDEEEFVCLSDDHLTNRSGPVPAELNSYNEKGGLMRNLIIRRGAPVMMISNHTKSQYKEDGSQCPLTWSSKNKLFKPAEPIFIDNLQF